MTFADPPAVNVSAALNWALAGPEDTVRRYFGQRDLRRLPQHIRRKILMLASDKVAVSRTVSELWDELVALRAELEDLRRGVDAQELPKWEVA